MIFHFQVKLWQTQCTYLLPLGGLVAVCNHPHVRGFCYVIMTQFVSLVHNKEAMYDMTEVMKPLHMMTFQAGT